MRTIWTLALAIATSFSYCQDSTRTLKFGLETGIIKNLVVDQNHTLSLTMSLDRHRFSLGYLIPITKNNSSWHGYAQGVEATYKFYPNKSRQAVSPFFSFDGAWSYSHGTRYNYSAKYQGPTATQYSNYTFSCIFGYFGFGLDVTPVQKLHLFASVGFGGGWEYARWFYVKVDGNEVVQQYPYELYFPDPWEHYTGYLRLALSYDLVQH